MTFHVTILHRAERDAQQIFEWIAERSPDGATRWWSAFEAAVRKLSENPKGYGAAPENDHMAYDLRQFLFKTPRGRTYRAVFVIVNEEIRILRVRGPGQPPLETDEVE